MTILRTRLLPLTLVAAVALLAIAACNDGDNGNGETDGASPTTVDMMADGDADGAADGDADDADGADGTDGTDGVMDGGADDGAGDGEPPPEDGADGEPTDGGVTEIRMIEGIQFDPTQVNVPAGTSVTILADNVSGLPHNFALYTSQEAAGGGEDPIVETEVCNGPCQEQVELNLDGGQYYFRCEVHGDSMSGTLTAR